MSSTETPPTDMMLRRLPKLPGTQSSPRPAARVIWRKPRRMLCSSSIGADVGGEHQAGVVPQLPRLQAVRSFGSLALAKGVHGDLGYAGCAGISGSWCRRQRGRSADGSAPASRST